MDAKPEAQPRKNITTSERTSDRELVVTRTINGLARIVFEAWTHAEQFKQWWVPKSAPITLLTCEVDARVGGGYRLVFDVGHGKTMAFFGKYLEVTPHSRLVWTNEESDENVVSTVTFTERDGKTLVVMSDLYPSKEALDAAIASGSTGGTQESLEQLEELIATMG